MAEKLTCDERALIESLAYALFPLDVWVRQKAYKPSQADLPWRRLRETATDGSEPPFADPLTPATLKVADFFESLLERSANEGALIERWVALHDSPLLASPLEDVATWRKERQLSEEPQFGILQAENALRDRKLRQLARLRIYRSGLKTLADVVSKMRPRHEDGTWNTLARELLTDACTDWSPDAVESSVFCYQFVNDLLANMLGGLGAAAEPWRNAVLTELGEFRRPGNKFSRADVDRASAAFVERVNNLSPVRAFEPPTDPQVLEHYRTFFGGW